MGFLREIDSFKILTHPLGSAQTSLIPECIFALWYDSLCAEEKQRAQALRFAVLRQDFIVAHGLLRMFLAWIMQESDPAALQFVFSERGRPKLDPSVHPDAPDFSLSHSRAHLAIAVGTGRSGVGVDVESLPWDSHAELADSVLACAEYRTWSAAPSSLKDAVFLRYWTRKEAYLKFTGQGLVDDLQAIDTSQQIVRVNGVTTGCLVHTLDPAVACPKQMGKDTCAKAPSQVLALAGAAPLKALSHFYFQAGSFITAPALAVL